MSQRKSDSRHFSHSNSRKHVVVIEVRKDSSLCGHRLPDKQIVVSPDIHWETKISKGSKGWSSHIRLKVDKSIDLGDLSLPGRSFGLSITICKNFKLAMWPLLIVWNCLNLVYLPENNMLGFIHLSERAWCRTSFGRGLNACVIGFREGPGSIFEATLLWDVGKRCPNVFDLFRS